MNFIFLAVGGFTGISLKCDHGSDGVSTRSKLESRTYKFYPEVSSFVCEVCCCLQSLMVISPTSIMFYNLPFIMYYKSAFVVFGM